jgi:FkbM family methyltransferase
MWKEIKSKIKHLLVPDLKYAISKAAGPIQLIGSDTCGWSVPKSFVTRDSICYLAGAGEDISFDIGLAVRFGCKVHIFDPTPRAKAHFEKVVQAASSGDAGKESKTSPLSNQLTEESSKLLIFHQVGIWTQSETLKFFAPRDKNHVSHSISNLQNTSDYFDANVMRLSEIMRTNRHDSIDLLKLDIEGAEFQVIDTILADNLKIKVFCVEFHQSTPGSNLEIQQTLDKLVAHNYRIVARKDLDFTFINTKFFKPGSN